MWKWFAAMLENLRSWLRAVRRAATPGPRHPSDNERRIEATTQRESIRRVLAADDLAAPLEHEERQQLAYWRLWRLIRPAETGAIPPETLDPSVSEHVDLALTVVGDYDAAREEPGEFADCLYRPVSELPYPQAAIRRCCEFLIRIADGGPVRSRATTSCSPKNGTRWGLRYFRSTTFSFCRRARFRVRSWKTWSTASISISLGLCHQ